MEKAKSKHVGIWIRVSTEDQAHGEARNTTKDELNLMPNRRSEKSKRSTTSKPSAGNHK